MEVVSGLVYTTTSGLVTWVMSWSALGIVTTILCSLPMLAIQLASIFGRDHSIEYLVNINFHLTI